ncbi:stearoyl-CoA desaturase (delta-9 desaturase) [Pseudonocardia sediminis]|uniref:Stearoyl-CoA desaturase (Delta-9 desaturase) n=1 Tax=Pseudonocardia sediminis TaxID=1397368 RepID=A0A4Q7V7Y2_PSEST|nr:acyl-CoA desaturase [Pseudonocardia sediminis]RZT88889.1 stearoyl-CoA desaturase (delta-9 desaturase) [Pseudonocardia sediminis]
MPEAAPPRALSDHQRHIAPHVFVYVFAAVPALALVAAVPLAWGWGLSLLDAGMAVGLYVVSMLGVTVGFHRLFTHRAFTANRGLRIGLAVAGSLAVQGPVRHWVADHRRHHAYADKEGDPHSPWRYGTSPRALVRGFWHAHMGWLFDRDMTDQRRFTPDLLADRDMSAVHRAFTALTVLSLFGPAVVGGLVTMSWWGAFTAFFWAGLVRVALTHHVAWSTNSICHLVGERPWTSRDRSTNVWLLAIPSMGESWHNLHHADPTSARHGVGRGEIDISAGVIRLFEKLGWARDVRWPTPARLEKLAVKA